MSIDNHLRAALLHVSDTDADSTLVSIKALNRRQCLNSRRETEQAVGGQVRAGDVLQERT